MGGKCWTMALAFRMRCCRFCSKRHNRFLMGGSTSESLMSDSGWNCYMQAKRKFTWKIGLTAAHM